jgi:hypothetical protein
VMEKRGRLVGVLGVGNEEKKSKEEAKVEAKGVVAPAPVAAGAAALTAKKIKSNAASAGKTLSVGKKAPTATGQKKAKKPAASTAHPFASASTMAPVASTGVINPINVETTTTAPPAVKPITMPTQPAPKPTTIPPSKTAKKRGRPSTSKSPPTASTAALPAAAGANVSASPMPAGNAASIGKTSAKKRKKS